MTNQEKLELLFGTGFTAQEIARELQVTRSYVYNLRAGRRKASTNVTTRLSYLVKGLVKPPAVEQASGNNEIVESEVTKEEQNWTSWLLFFACGVAFLAIVIFACLLSVLIK